MLATVLFCTTAPRTSTRPFWYGTALIAVMATTQVMAQSGVPTCSFGWWDEGMECRAPNGQICVSIGNRQWQCSGKIQEPGSHFIHTNRHQGCGPPSDPDRILAACTALVIDSSESTRNKAIAYNNLGWAYQSKGNLDFALAKYNKALELNPKYALAYINRCDCYRQKGELEQAIRDCDSAINLVPRNELAHIVRGLVYRTKRDHLTAIANYNKAIEINPHSAKAYAHRCYEDRSIGELDGAIADCNKAIELDSKNAVAYNHRCLAYHGKHEYVRAVADCDEAIKLDPGHGHIYYLNRGMAYEGNGDSARAIESYRAALAFPIKLPTDHRVYEVAQKGISRLASSTGPERASQNPPPLALPNTTGVSQEVFPIASPNKVTILPVTINGVEGKLFLDTGASFVFLNNSFAEKAKVEIDESKTMQTQTANGIAQVRRGLAETVRLRSLFARDVQVLVPAKDIDSPVVDGLLGMSFLSRFNISIDESSVKLSSRAEEQIGSKPASTQRPLHPALGQFRVFGVKLGDFLNVRENPNASGKIVAQIPPDTGNVEVHSCALDSSQRWCKVTYAGATGWANASYLRHSVTGAPP